MLYTIFINYYFINYQNITKKLVFFIVLFRFFCYLCIARQKNGGCKKKKKSKKNLKIL